MFRLGCLLLSPQTVVIAGWTFPQLGYQEVPRPEMVIEPVGLALLQSDWQEALRPEMVIGLAALALLLLGYPPLHQESVAQALLRPD